MAIPNHGPGHAALAVLTAVFILAALVFAAMAWFSLVVPSVEFLHHHGG